MWWVLLLSFYLCSGVWCFRPIARLPCLFFDVNTSQSDGGQLLFRAAALQFSQTPNAASNPPAVTFQLSGSRVDLRRYVEGAEPDQLECEVHRYSTEGLHAPWPHQDHQGYNYWFTCTIRHKAGLFNISSILRHPSDHAAPGQPDHHSLRLIRDSDVLTTTVAMVMKTKTPHVKAALGSKKKLHCQFAIDHERADATVSWHWRHHGKMLHNFTYNFASSRTEGTGVGLEALKGGDASFTFPSSAASRDTDYQGIYVCSLAVSPVRLTLDVHLSIEEPPKVFLNVDPVLSIQEGHLQKVLCEARGYYPLDVEITFSKYKPSAPGHADSIPPLQHVHGTSYSSHRLNMTDMTYSVSAHFYLWASQSDLGKQFTCSVSHQSLAVPIRKSFILNVEDPVRGIFFLSVVLTTVTLSALLFMMLSLRSARRRAFWRRAY